MRTGRVWADGRQCPKKPTRSPRLRASAGGPWGTPDSPLTARFRVSASCYSGFVPNFLERTGAKSRRELEQTVAKYSPYVIDGDQKIPFLRGMLTHSLIERGLGFKEAYHAANKVRDHIRDRGSIPKRKLRHVIDSVLKSEFGERYAPKKILAVAPPARILVRGEQAVPFSKGILSQSLQASGLEPQIAYNIALEVEQSLLKKRQLEISRDDLRALIYKNILKKHEPEFAERYLVWRYFKSPDKPVVILIGGATGVGKTSVATEVAHRIGIGKILSTDTIRQIMRMMFSHDLLPAIHHSSFEAWKEFPSEENDSNVVVTAFREQATKIVVGVRALLERAINENSSIIIDGVHLVPGLISYREFERRAYIVPVVISTLNAARHLERFPLRQSQARNRSAKKYRENFKSILHIQDYILEMAENHDTPIVENKHLDETVASILTVITNTLRDKLKLSGRQLVAKAL